MDHGMCRRFNDGWLIGLLVGGIGLACAPSFAQEDYHAKLAH
jgi:hypothetical protein